MRVSKNYSMKHKVLVILTSILFLSFSDEIISRNENPEKNGKILLFEYETETELKILKDFKRKNKRYRYICGSRLSSAEFNSYNRILYVDEALNVSDSSRLIFFDTYDVMTIALPFQYFDIILDSFINDSTVQFTLNKKKLILKPGQEYIDSTTSIKTEGKRVIQYNKKFYLKNRGFILKKNIITEKERMDRLNKEDRIRDSMDMIDLENMDKRK
jgi:hypothetical protein